MSVELLLVTDGLDADALADTLLVVLADALSANDQPAEDDDVAAMITLTHRSAGEGGRSVWGARIELPEDVPLPGAILDQFLVDLPDGDAVLHACRFEDSDLRAELDGFAHELFSLEMKLRRVLSIIYLRSGLGDQPFDLLRRDRVKPVTPGLAHAAMLAAGENQLFHMSFSQYGDLDALPALKIDRVEAALADAGDFDDFRRALTRPPIDHEDDKQLIAGLKERMNVLESMRNCIAHNRRPPGNLLQNYPNARDKMSELLDAYLAQLAIS